MRERIMDALRKVLDIFRAFTPGQKAMSVIAVLALAVGGYFFATWAGQPTYSPLFTNLASADASAIVDKLTADGTAYQLTDGGSTILVPKDSVYAERIKMSGAGLPAQSDTAGYSLLDKQSSMTSDFMQQVGYQRALEGELAKTIKAIDGVTGATVHLAIPKKDVFADEQQKTTASVLVATSGEKKLSSTQVQAIVHLVASSVGGLDADQVTVVGADGTTLNTAGQSATDSGDAQSTQTQAFETRMNTALQKMLTQALGPGHAVVQVTADLDFDTKETTTQQYLANPSTPPLSEQNKTETYTGNGTATGGVLGPDNIQVPGGTGGSGLYSESTSTKNNAVGLVTETTKSAPGAIKKLSVAVLLDSSVAADQDAARLQQLVSTAAGLDTTRGDTVAVTAMKFDKTTTNQIAKDLATQAKADSTAQLKSWIQTGVMSFGVLTLLLMAMLSGRKKRRKKIRLSAEERAQFDEMQAAIDAARRAEIEGVEGEGVGAIGPGEEVDPDALEIDELLQHQTTITSLIERQPDEVAQLLRGWIADRRG
jgi:flagellar M-ring protein FliF